MKPSDHELLSLELSELLMFDQRQSRGWTRPLDQDELKLPDFLLSPKPRHRPRHVCTTNWRGGSRRPSYHEGGERSTWSQSNSS